MTLRLWRGFRRASRAAVDMFEILECTNGPVAQWIRHRPTEPGIAGSSPAGVMFRLLPAHSFFSLHRFESKTSRSMGGRLPLPLRSCRTYFAVARRKHLRLCGCCARAVPLAKRPPSAMGAEPQAISSQLAGALALWRGMAPPVWATHFALYFLLPRKRGCCGQTASSAFVSLCGHPP